MRKRRSGIYDGSFEGIRRIFRIASGPAPKKAKRLPTSSFFGVDNKEKRSGVGTRFTPVRLDPDSPPNLFETSVIDAG